MAMGTRKGRERQSDMWIATSAIVETPGNAFYDRLNKILSEHKFDARVEALCRKFYKKSPYGRPSLAPGVYFRALLIGYFEGVDRSVVLPGARPIPCPCAAFWVTPWTKRRQTIRPFPALGGC